MGSSLVSNIPDAVWLPVVFFLLGAGPGTLLMRWLRLPAYFWLPVSFASACLASYPIFYIYFLDSGSGRMASRSIVICSAVLFAWQCRRADIRRFLTDRDVWLPGLLTGLAFAGYLCLLAWPGSTANYRVRTPVPPEDNIVPRYLADWLDFEFYKHQTPPAISDDGYRSSDRPPLQTAITLTLRPWQLRVNAWMYQIIGTMCQLGWIPALYALARGIGLDRRRMTVLLLATVCSGFFFLNSIYTWPKLLAATLCLTGLALWVHLSGEREQTARTAAIFVATVVLFALSLLAHGGPFFSLVALPFLFVWFGLSKTVRWRDAVVGVVLAALLLTPWLAYQHFYDPPGDRLLKIHLAGVVPITSRSIWQTLADQYRALTPGDYVAGRWANLKEQFLVFGKIGMDDPIFYVQWQQFFHHLPALDFLAFGFLAMLLRPGRRDRLRREPSDSCAA